MSSTDRVEDTDRTRMIASETVYGSVETKRGTFFSSIASSAKRAVSKLKSAPSSSSSSSSAAASELRPSSSIANRETFSQDQRIHLVQLGIYDREAELDDMIGRFNCTCMNDTVTLEKFVIQMIKRGQDPMWADAAFRAFDLNADGDASLYEFILADLSLRNTDNWCIQNDFWLALRRRVIFTIYDRSASGKLGRKDLVDLLDDMSSSDKSPLIFGVRNNLWMERQDTNKNLIADEFSLQIVTQDLASSKIIMAQRDFEYEQLQLKYIQLEKTTCQLKLENAKLRVQIDSYKGLPPDVRKIDLNGVEDILFQEEEEVSGDDIHAHIHAHINMHAQSEEHVIENQSVLMDAADAAISLSASNPAMPSADMLLNGIKQFLVPSNNVKYDEAGRFDFQHDRDISE